MISLSCSGKFWRAGVLVEMALFLQGTQHSFQKRKRKTATRASPHTITITARRLTESSRRQEKVAVGEKCKIWIGRQERRRRKEKNGL